VRDAVQRATDLGHTAEEIELPWDADVYERDFLPVLFVSTAEEVSKAAVIRGGHLKTRDLEANTRLMAQMGSSFQGAAYTAALDRWGELSRRFETVHERYDLICVPTLAEPPARVGQFQSSAAETFIVRAAVSPECSCATASSARWPDACSATCPLPP
jgi:Asp-tRNA(Asn)/Glu-tRNA(Gln) amidotransferase A subunit family amidase